MQYLVRLVTPPKGTVLDCFSGTGTTAEAAFREGMGAVLIECEGEYQNDIRRRMGLVLGGRKSARELQSRNAQRISPSITGRCSIMNGTTCGPVPSIIRSGYEPSLEAFIFF